MGVELRIESEDAVRLAEELATLTGRSVTDAVVDVLRESLARAQETRRRRDTILAAAAEVRKHLRHPLPSSDHSFLYGEDGLPK